MIENEQQYQTTKEWMRRFNEELRALRALPLSARHAHPKVRQAQEDSLQQTIDDLQNQASTYEARQTAAARRPFAFTNKNEPVVETV